jgi:hypothetical protein
MGTQELHCGKITLDQMLAWLSKHGANSTPHSGRTLLTHLKNTYLILEKSGHPESICRAGLFHSVYGTQYFKKQTLKFQERKALQVLIGEEAENLAWLFCTLDRPKTFENYFKHRDGSLTEFVSEFQEQHATEQLPLMMETLPALLSIEAANLLDQKLLWRNSRLVSHALENGILNEDGNSILSKGEARELATATLMLETAKESLQAMLVQHINAKRQAVTSPYFWAMNMRAIKAQQAYRVLNGQGASEENVGLVLNYANCNGLSLEEAAREILRKESEFAEVLTATEIQKDCLNAKIRQAQSFGEIQTLREEITQLMG